MKTKIFLSVIMLFFLVFSCKKTEDTPSPTTSTAQSLGFSGCRISQFNQDVIGIPQVDFETVNFSYDTDGFIKNVDYVFKRNNVTVSSQTTLMTYKNGLLAQLNDLRQFHIEVYEYLNNVLSGIKIPKSDTPILANLELKVTTDANKRITKIEDVKSGFTDIKRDMKGNITEVKNFSSDGNIENFRVEITGYDDKKTYYELMKGFQLDFFAMADTYVEKPLFSVGASGNPLKMKTYRKGKLEEDLEFTYEYTVEGYPTTISTLNKITNRTTTQTIVYAGCK